MHRFKTGKIIFRQIGAGDERFCGLVAMVTQLGCGQGAVTDSKELLVMRSIAMDLATLHTTDALVNVTCSIMCLLLWRNQQADRCFAWWGVGLAIFGLVAAIYPFSATTPIANSAGYSLLDIATVAIWRGFWSFDGRRAPYALLLLVPCASLATCLVVGAISGNWLLAGKIALLAHCGVAVAQASYVMKGSIKPTSSRSICAFAIFTIAASIAVPAVLEGSWLTVPQADGFILVVDHIMTIVITLSVIAMVGERDFSAVLWASRHDPLTGLLNRKGLIEAVTKVAGDQAVIMMDLDVFKSINDRFGHEGGDEVLRNFATRTSATIGDRGVVARLGGEEFLIVSPTSSIVAADQLAEAVRAETAQAPAQFGAITIPFTVSVGVALQRAGDDFFGAVKKADEALYAAKSGGRNCVAHYRDSARPDHLAGSPAGAERRSVRRDNYPPDVAAA